MATRGRRAPRTTRANRTLRTARLAAGSALAAGLALAITAPPSLAQTAAPASAVPARHATARSSAPSGVQAKAAAIANASTGTVLWSRELNTERPIGSITKVMTALVVISDGDLNRTITIPSAVVSYVQEHDASSAGLHPGDKLTASELLNALLLPSGADAAYALADAYGPGLTKFIGKMNAVAKALGMTRTHFSNFDGLPWPTEYSTYSTPADLLILGRVAMTSRAFRSIVAQRSYRLAAGDGHHAYLWDNLDPLLGAYPGAIGIKTGYTAAAGHCLLFEATRNGRWMIGVTLDSPGTGTTVNAADPTRLLNWAFSLPA